MRPSTPAALLLALALLGAPVAAQEAPAADPAADPAAGPAIEAVIRDQLRAFNDRDVAAAWEHASPMIQGLFGTPETFGSMVERGYPMVWSNAEARFMDLREEAGALRQRVMIADAEGRLWVLDYEMVETPDGWQINGVVVLPAPEVGA